jgi:predicted dehydrogenase
MKIGVFGLGFMGSTHLRAIQKMSQAEVVAVACDEPKRLEGDLTGIQGNIGGPGDRWDFSGIARYSDPYEALANPQIEAVDICLPTNLHAPVAIAALQAGKHVLVEKPMALSGEDCDDMVRAAAGNHRVLMTAQVLRFMPAYARTRQMIQGGELGTIRSAIFRRRCAAPGWNQWLDKREISGGGVFDLLIHDLDFCLHAFGKPQALTAVGYEDLPRGIDWITVELFYAGIGGVVISGGWHHPKSFPFSMEFTVVGDRGTVDYNSSHTPLTVYRADGGTERLPLPQVDGYQAEIEYFLGCCIGSRVPELCRAEESATAVKLAVLMQKARARQGERIECNL